MLRKSLEVEENMGASKVKTVVNSLSDGGWHSFDDLIAVTKLDRETVLRIANFFREYEFVEISVGGEAVKLDKDYIRL